MRGRVVPPGSPLAHCSRRRGRGDSSGAGPLAEEGTGDKVEERTGGELLESTGGMV